MIFASIVLFIFAITWLTAVGAIILVGRAIYDIALDIYVFYIMPCIGHDIKLRERYGSWAVITGCTSGIGRGYAKAFARRNLNLVLIGRNEKKLESVDSELKEINPNIQTRIIVHDFAVKDSASDLHKLKSAMKEILGDVGILVNNVGVYGTSVESFGKEFQSLKPDPYSHAQEVLRVNLGSMLLLTAVVLPRMIERKRGMIVNVSSIVASHPVGGDSIYAPTKAFQDSFSRSLRIDLRGTGVEVQGVYPGFVDTAILPETFKAKLFPFKLAECESYCERAVRSIGMQSETFGDVQHRIESMVCFSTLRTMPLWIKNPLLEFGSKRRRLMCNMLNKKQ